MQRDAANRFIGPDHSARIWYSAQTQKKDHPEEIEQSAAAKVDSSPVENKDQAASKMTVEVWLFGLLSTLTEERPLKLHLTNNATPMDVLDNLEERFGSEILSHIKDPIIGILPCCRIFVDGEMFEDVHAPIAANRDAASIELILLKGFEGG